jgi:hypothetical protein
MRMIVIVDRNVSAHEKQKLRCIQEKAKKMQRSEWEE